MNLLLVTKKKCIKIIFSVTNRCINAEKKVIKTVMALQVTRSQFSNIIIEIIV